MAFYFVSTFAIAQTPTKQPALRLSRTKNLHFAKAPFPGFSADVTLLNGKKPEFLINRLMDMLSNENDFILDFHLGSGTTCAVAHKMRRRYIGIEQLNYGKNDSIVRLNNVIKGDKSGISKDVDWQGGGSFTYCELTQHNANIIDRIEQVDTTEALKSIFQEIEKTDFITYKIKPETIAGSRYFCESLFWASQPKQAAKT